MSEMFEAMAEALEAAADVFRRWAAKERSAAEVIQGDPSELTPYSQPRGTLIARARRIHPMLGQVQERMLPLLHAAGVSGMTTGDIARALGYDQANAGLTLKAMARQGLVVRDTSGHPNRWRLVSELLDAAPDEAEGD